MTSHEGLNSGISESIPMLETDLPTIDAQIAALVEARSAYSFLCNFASRLPGGFSRSIAVSADMLETPIVEPNLTNPLQDSFHSPRAFETNWRTFFSDIDKALEESGTTSEDLERIRTSNLLSSEERETQYRCLLPAYRHLRTMGYSHHDLRI